MIRKTHVAAAFAFPAALTAAGVALAQPQTTSAQPPAAPAQSAAPAAEPPWAKPATSTFQPINPYTNQPTYAVDPPPEGSSGVYLPAVVLGYAKSAAGCVVAGCEDGPQPGGAPAASSSGSTEAPPPANPGASAQP